MCSAVQAGVFATALVGASGKGTERLRCTGGRALRRIRLTLKAAFATGHDAVQCDVQAGVNHDKRRTYQNDNDECERPHLSYLTRPFHRYVVFTACPSAAIPAIWQQHTIF